MMRHEHRSPGRGTIRRDRRDRRDREIGRNHGNGRTHQNDRGSVTAEYAVLLPGAALLLVAGLLVGAAAVQQIRLEEAAGAAARQVARGEDPGTAADTARRMAGDAADLTTGSDAGWVSVTVSAPPPGPLAWWDGWGQEAIAHAPDQWVVSP